jgi:hypothetical protein
MAKAFETLKLKFNQDFCRFNINILSKISNKFPPVFPGIKSCPKYFHYLNKE